MHYIWNVIVKDSSCGIVIGKLLGVWVTSQFQENDSYSTVIENAFDYGFDGTTWAAI
jgi:hypothetical protein